MSKIKSLRRDRLTGLLVAALGLLAVLGFVAFSGAGAAQLTDGNITLDQPDNQVVEVDVSFSGSTDATATLERNGVAVDSATVSGTSSTTKTIQIDTTGLSTGEYYLNVTATDESVASFSDSRIITTHTDAMNVSKNDTVAVDVGFSSSVISEANVTVLSDTGNTLSEGTLTFDPVEAADGTGTETFEWESGSSYDNLDVKVVTSPVESQTSVVSKVSSGTAAGFDLGGSNKQMYAAALLVLFGAAYAYDQEMI